MWWRKERGGGNGELSKQKWYGGTHSEGRSSREMMELLGNLFNVCLS